MNPRNILLAVDGSENAMRAVEYARAMTSGGDFHLRLLHVERLPERDIFADDEAWREACVQNHAAMQAFLEQARTVLLEDGLPPERLSLEYVHACAWPFDAPQGQRCSPDLSVSREILRRMQEDGFGTVVIGRRGLSKAEEFIFGSVSNKIMHLAKNCTVWVVA